MCGESRMHGVDRGKSRRRVHLYIWSKSLPIGIVYGIAVTAMNFFTDPTIAALTSGRPSQTIDLGGFSFPRRLGVRFHPDHAKRNRFIGLQCIFQAYADDKFTESLGKEFRHTDTVQREGWARYFFEGIFPKDTAYIKLELRDATTGHLVHDFYFRFKKQYMTSLDGRTYFLDPVLGTRVAKDGILTELLYDEKKKRYVAGTTTFRRKSLVLDEESGDYELKERRVPVITQNYVKYTEKPKVMFMVDVCRGFINAFPSVFAVHGEAVR